MPYTVVKTAFVSYKFDRNIGNKNVRRSHFGFKLPVKAEKQVKLKYTTAMIEVNI